MSKLKFIVMNTQSDLYRAFPIMKELREHIIFNDFLAIYSAAHEANKYELIALESDGNIIGLMGYRILYDFVHGKHLYIDDLVCSKFHRSQGYGAKLLKFSEQLAEKHGCEKLRVSTGNMNQRAISFYQKEGWELKAVTFKKLLMKNSKTDELGRFS